MRPLAPASHSAAAITPTGQPTGPVLYAGALSPGRSSYRRPKKPSTTKTMTTAPTSQTMLFMMSS
jgi:hypothetical protein